MCSHGDILTPGGDFFASSVKGGPAVIRSPCAAFAVMIAGVSYF